LRHNAQVEKTPAKPSVEIPMATPMYSSFADFYPFYLSQHSDRTCRRLHFTGTSLGLLSILCSFATLNFWWLLAGLVSGYAFAWVGHYFFEKNRPATFTHPFYSFLGDWVMWKETLTGRIKL
jgi:hypothetical protein